MDLSKLAEGVKNFDVVNGKPVLKPNVYDRGGATAYGITHKTLDSAYAQGITNHCDITKLTKDEALAIYRKNYWDKYGWDGLPYPLCLCAFDVVVNGGHGNVDLEGRPECFKKAVIDNRVFFAVNKDGSADIWISDKQNAIIGDVSLA